MDCIPTSREVDNALDIEVDNLCDAFFNSLYFNTFENECLFESVEMREGVNSVADYSSDIISTGSTGKILVSSVSPSFSIDLRRAKKIKNKLRKNSYRFGNMSLFSSGFSIFSPKPLLSFPFPIDIVGVHNLTGRFINNSILKFLSLGDNFIFNSYSVSKTRIRSDMADFHRRIRLKAEFQHSDSDDMPVFYVPNTTYQPARGPQDLEAYIKATLLKLDSELLLVTKSKPLPSSFLVCLKSLRLALKDEVVILKADKGLGLVLMLRSDCLNIMLTHLWNRNVYIGHDSLPSIPAKFTELRSILFQSGLNSNSEEWKYILQSISTTVNWGRLYFLVKVHKNSVPPPLRPICSQLNTCSYFASKYISKILVPLVKRHIPTYFEDSIYFIEYLTVTKFDKPVVLVAADIENLYPSINIEDCIYRVNLFLLSVNSDGLLNCGLIISLLRFILSNNYFEIGGLFFHQISGVAMGTPCAVMVSVIYVHMLETAAMSTMDANRKPLYLIRFIDDYFGIFLKIEDAHDFFISFNGQSTTIKVPMDELQVSYLDNNTGVNFLDFKIRQLVQEPFLCTTLYSKADFHQYMHFGSKHPRHMKTNFIRSELNRIMLRCSTLSDCILAFERFYNALIKRGYPLSILDSIFQKHHTNCFKISDLDYKGKRLQYITSCLIKKFNRQRLSPRVVYKRKAGSNVNFHDVLSTAIIDCGPSFSSVFHNRDPIIVSYKFNRLGPSILKKLKNFG